MNERLGIPKQDEAYDASDPKQVEKAEQAAKLRVEQRKAVSAQLLSDIPGRAWLWGLLADTKVFQDRVVTDSEYQNGFLNGELEIGLKLVRHLCRSSPENFGKLIRGNDKTDG